jgi:hypothetical protein
MSLAQLSAAHIVLGGAKRQAPAPSHWPSRPQTSLPGAQSSCGSVPDMTPSHEPSGLPVTAFEQETQGPSHAAAQHTPSRHGPLSQSAFAWHFSPAASPGAPPALSKLPAALPPADVLPALLDDAPLDDAPLESVPPAPAPAVTCSMRLSNEQPAKAASTSQKSQTSKGRFAIRNGLSRAR